MRARVRVRSESRSPSMCSCGCWLSSERTQLEPTRAVLVTSTKRRAGPLALLGLLAFVLALALVLAFVLALALVLPLVRVLASSSAHGTIGGGGGAPGTSGGRGIGLGGRRRFARERPLLPGVPTRKHLPPPSLDGAACQMNARHNQLTVLWLVLVSGTLSVVRASMRQSAAQSSSRGQCVTAACCTAPMLPPSAASLARSRLPA